MLIVPNVISKCYVYYCQNRYLSDVSDTMLLLNLTPSEYTNIALTIDTCRGIRRALRVTILSFDNPASNSFSPASVSIGAKEALITNIHPVYINTFLSRNTLYMFL